MAKRKTKEDNDSINIMITPETMDEYAKGEYEYCDQFCDQIEQMGLGAILGEGGVSDLRKYNDEKMSRYDPDYMKKKEQEREKKEQPVEKKKFDRFSGIF